MKNASQITKKIHIRFAETYDIEDLFKWRNDEGTRLSSFNTKKITFEQHKNWFLESLSDVNRNIFIICDKKCNNIGQIRFDKNDDIAEIDITINPKYRNRGFGTDALMKSSDLYMKNFNISTLVAKIKKNNLSSLKIFQKAGFEIRKEFDSYFVMVNLK